MEELQQDIKCLVDTITVPEKKLNETVDAALTKEKKREKRSFIRKQNLIAGIASIFLLAFGTLLFNSYSKEPVTGQYSNSILYNQGDEVLKRMVKEDNVENLSLEAEDENIKVILEEGYLDNYQLVISYRVENNNSVISTSDKSGISKELFVDGVSKGQSIYDDGIVSKDLSQNGDIFTFLDTKGIPTNAEMELRIYSINGIEGFHSSGAFSTAFLAIFPAAFLTGPAIFYLLSIKLDIPAALPIKMRDRFSSQYSALASRIFI